MKEAIGLFIFFGLVGIMLGLWVSLPPTPTKDQERITEKGLTCTN